MFVPRVIVALGFCISSAHSITPREEMEADRKQMEAAIAEKHCPDVLKYKTYPILRDVSRKLHWPTRYGS